MALADILARIEGDARAEAEQILAAARADADSVRRAASERAAELRAEMVTEAEAVASAEVETRLAAARLRSRDRSVADKRAVIDRVLATAADKISALPDPEYVALIGRCVARVADDGAEVALGVEDADRLRPSLEKAVTAAGGSPVRLASETAAMPRGVEVRGDRVRVEISPAAMVAAEAADLTALVASILFGDAEE